MRRVFFLCLFIVMLLVIASGCTQPAPAIPAATTPEQIPVTPLPVTTTPDTTKQLTFEVSKTEKTVNVTYTGGPDAADLLALDVLITNQDGSQIKQTFVEPAVNTPLLFTYMGLADPTVVNIVGTFGGGYQQTVLMYYF
jgi:hypothetical protein